MGTRHLIMVKLDDRLKVAQYGQWDGYPSGQGADILAFLHEHANDQQFIENVRQTSFLEDPDAHIENLYVQIGVDIPGEFISYEDSKKFSTAFPEYSRDTGAKLLNLILEKPRHLVDSRDFGNDEVFCEFAYLINLDTREFEIHASGYNQTSQIAKYSLDDLPSVEKMVEDC